MQNWVMLNMLRPLQETFFFFFTGAACALKCMKKTHLAGLPVLK